MSKETRTVRPFTGLNMLAPILDHSLLYFGQEKCEPGAGHIADLAVEEFMRRPLVIEWASDDEAFSQLRVRLVAGAADAGLDAQDLSFVVVASTPYLKIADVVLEHPLSDLHSLDRITDLVGESRARALSAPFSGFAVDAYLLLNKSLEPRPLRPHVKGTWIARARFRIETTLGPALLPPTPLTKELKEKLRLPARTIRYVQFGDHDVLQPYREQEQPVFYVDEDLLAQLNVRKNSAASKAVQLQLALDFVSSVVWRASRNSEIETVAYDDVRAGLLGSVIRIAAGPGASDVERERILKSVATDPDYVLARAEHAIDLAGGYAGVLKDGDA